MKRTSIYIIVVLVFGSISLHSQSMQWVFQDNGIVNDMCTSSTDCNNNIICYGLEFTPSVSGVLTSYTTGFFLDCVPRITGVDAGNPIISNTSCTMATNVNDINDCGGSGLILFNSSGNSGTLSISPGMPIILHQVCFNLEENESVNIVKDITTNLTLSVDLSGGGASTEFPSYTTFQASHNSACTVLAISLKKFDVSKQNNSSLLEWSTSSELNNDYFDVEWSTDGRHFENIGFVQGNGTTDQQSSYEFKHKNPASGINYYRLVSIEYDGKTEYSMIRSVQFSSTAKNAVLLFPNPVNNQFVVRLLNPINNSTVLIEIRTATGQLIEKNNYYIDNQKLTINTSSYPTGIYFFIIKLKDGNYVEKFTKAY